MTAAEASKIILNIVEFLGSPISALRCISRNFTYSYVRCIPRDLRRLDLELFSLPSQIDFLRVHQRRLGLKSKKRTALVDGNRQDKGEHCVEHHGKRPPFPGSGLARDADHGYETGRIEHDKYNEGKS